MSDPGPRPSPSAGSAPRPGARGATAAGVTALTASALTASALTAFAPTAAAVTAQVPEAAADAAPAADAGRRGAELAAPMRHVAAAEVTYTVRAGDTVSHIAARLGTTVAAVVAANGLDADASIREGQVLTVPSGGDAAPAAPATSPAASGSHTVSPGDTVGALAVRYGTSTAAIVAANGLDGRAFIRDGQVLAIPGGSTGAAPAAAPAAAGPAAAGSYTVRPGDTLSHVAARAGTTVASLRDANPGLDAQGTIRIGQVLAVPGAAPASAPMSNTFAGRTYPAATVQAATVNRDVLAARSVPGAGEMQRLVADTARANGVDPALAQAISFQESGFNMRAVSPANAVGAMQVIPSSGEWASVLAGRSIDLLDPRDNALAGVLILKAHAASGADEATVIAAYYQGMGSVTRNGLYPDTRRYVANVQTLMARYR